MKQMDQEQLRLAMEVLESEEHARRWLSIPNHFLEGGTPLECADKKSGKEIARQLLMQIEHGVLS